jgi:cell division protein ZapA (FtsZ GTPase activity inhibitor)
MSSDAERNVVVVEIGGEEYGIRALASPEHTRECAALVDQKLSEVMRGSLIQVHKGGILTALVLADELLKVREELDGLRSELSRRADVLTGEIEDRLALRGLAGDS